MNDEAVVKSGGNIMFIMGIIFTVLTAIGVILVIMALAALSAVGSLASSAEAREIVRTVKANVNVNAIIYVSLIIMIINLVVSIAMITFGSALKKLVLEKAGGALIVAMISLALSILSIIFGFIAGGLPWGAFITTGLGVWVFIVVNNAKKAAGNLSAA